MYLNNKYGNRIENEYSWLTLTWDVFKLLLTLPSKSTLGD